MGNALLSRAADRDVDLLVMGAYSHARWAERILGGVTRTVLFDRSSHSDAVTREMTCVSSREVYREGRSVDAGR